MNFNIDSDMMVDTVSQMLEEVGARTSEAQFENIVNAINKALPGVISVITRGISDYWKSEARDSGTGWGSKYAAAITYKVEGAEGEIYLDDELIDKTSNKPNIMFAKMVEQGMKSWSIKDALLASDKAKEGRDGVKYIIIPFPVAAPRNSGQGRMASQFGGREMTAEMHKIVKAGGRLPAGSTLQDGTDVSGLSRYTTRQHHTGYGIFRCVSEKSTGWEHPGVAPSPVFPKVIEKVNEKIQEVLTAFCKEIVNEFTSS